MIVRQNIKYSMVFIEYMLRCISHSLCATSHRTCQFSFINISQGSVANSIANSIVITLTRTRLRRLTAFLYVDFMVLFMSCNDIYLNSHDNPDITCVTFLSFLARDSMLSVLYAIANPSVCPSVRLSVRLSVTRVDQSKTVEARIVQFSPYSSPIPLVFAG